MENVITSNIAVKSVFDLINSLQYIFNPFGQNKLSVNIVVIAKEPVKYTYTISGITEDVDFTYGVDAFAQEFTIPVIGLYANRVSAFTVTFENQSGQQEQLTRGLSTASLDFSDVLTHIDFEIANQGVADATLGNGWLFTNFQTCRCAFGFRHKQYMNPCQFIVSSLRLPCYTLYRTSVYYRARRGE